MTKDVIKPVMSDGPKPQFRSDGDLIAADANDMIARLSVKIGAQTNEFLEERIKEAFAKGCDLVYRQTFFAASPMLYQAQIDYKYVPAGMGHIYADQGDVYVKWEDINNAINEISVRRGLAKRILAE